MRRQAMIMAGGDGSRMAASGGDVAKPLTMVAGATLLEHNFFALVRQGFGRILVAASLRQAPVLSYVRDRLSLSAARAGVALDLLEETSPRGNIGAAGALAAGSEPLLTVFADNLTTLELSRLYETHRRSGASATLATHRHRLQNPFGEVLDDDGRVTAYREKPARDVTVSSGVCVFSPRALRVIAPSEPLGLGQLVERLLANGEIVRTYPHAAPWLDVNDLGALPAAEALVRARPDLFAAPVEEGRLCLTA